MTLVKRTTIPSILDEFFNADRFFDADLFSYDRVPAVNISEKENQYEVELAVPGMKKEDIQIHLDKNVLTVSGESKTEKEEKDKKYTRKEFSYSSFSRSFSLPANADESKVDAKYENGILKLSIAKKALEQPQKKVIAIN